MRKIIQELLLLVFVLIPIIQLSILWNAIPNEIPLHYNIDGQVDNYGDKNTLRWFVPTCLILTYLLLLGAPFIDPKKRIDADNKSYYIIRLIIAMFLSAILIVYHFALIEKLSFVQGMAFILFGFIILFGNFMPTLKPNYFIGIRTPWTLENPQVWMKTHRFSGKLWMICGVIGLVAYLMIPSLPDATAVGCIIFLAFISVGYSYISFKNIKN